MKKKIFTCSDPHGHLHELKLALKEAGWDEHNLEYLLIVCGDIFDRGTENIEMYQFLKDLVEKDKAIIIRGNHDSMLIDYLDGTSTSCWNYCNNGTCTTIDEFLGEDMAFETYCKNKGVEITIGAFTDFIVLARTKINKKYPELLSWLNKLPWFYETEKYIFTHAAIAGREFNWKTPQHISWEKLSWDDGGFLGESVLNTDKTLVLGHFDSGALRRMYSIGSSTDFSILDVENLKLWSNYDSQNKDVYRTVVGRKIFLDTRTIATKKVNVLVIEDSLIS